MSAPLTSGFSAGRRRFLLGLGSLGITSALPLTTFTPAEAHAENWSGGQKATPPGLSTLPQKVPWLLPSAKPGIPSAPSGADTPTPPWPLPDFARGHGTDAQGA